MQELRIKFLKEEIELNSDDPFNYYALALEYCSSDIQQARSLFSVLELRFPDYLPTYYKAANFYFELDEIQKAEELFLKGIAVATQQQNLKTLKELQSSYMIFKSETDDDF